jgi:hypothetical protein
VETDKKRWGCEFDGKIINIFLKTIIKKIH